MGNRHLSLETMAKWLTGRLEHDDLLRDVVPHHLEQCPGCREAYETLETLKREIGHWDEEVALLETREAPELAALLDQKTPEERADLIEEEESLHTWGLCHLLLKKSLAAARQEPGVAFHLADQAVRLTAHLGSTYDPQWVLGLRAGALACRGNARRVLGELHSAESDFHEARGSLERSGMEGSRFEAEVMDLESSLRRDQRRFGVALDLAEQALELYRTIQDSDGAAKMFLQKAKILEDSHDLAGAIELLRRPEEAIDPEREPHLFATARFNLICCLSEAGHLEEARDLLPEVRTRFQETAQPLDRVRLRWEEARIAFGLGKEEEAEAAFREVQVEFLALHMDYNAALVALDRAVLLSKQGRGAELKQLAVDLMAAFEAREIHRESTAVLILFQRACEEERMTSELARQLAGLLRQRKG